MHPMKSITNWTAVLVGLSATAYAQQPPDVVKSDVYYNTAMGTIALGNLTPTYTSGNNNTAGGYAALDGLTTGANNAAFGTEALLSIYNSSDNTAIGAFSMESASYGNDNTAVGQRSLGGFNEALSQAGSDNTAIGSNSMSDYYTGNYNTAVGFNSLAGSELGTGTGSQNTAVGAESMPVNTSGSNNVVSGYETLFKNTTGSWNTASGFRSLYSNTTGANNTAAGISALKSNTTGSYNIAMGNSAGENLTTGSNNIEIGNVGTASDNNVIKIGTEGVQAETFIAGIYNTSVKGSVVMVNSSGQLGVVVSSERFKTAVEPMGSDTAKLAQLRPVTFKLKSDATGTRQYGLIAEQVAKVYPELVIRDDQGRIDGVRYDELAPMLLNEMQRQQATIAAQNQKIASLELEVAEVNDLKQEMRAALLQLRTKEQLVAQR